MAREVDLAASRRAIKQNVEVVTLVQTPMGPIVSVYIEGDDPVNGNAAFAASQGKYDRWFKDECKTIFPPAINFDEPLPPIEEIFDSQALMARV